MDRETPQKGRLQRKLFGMRRLLRKADERKEAAMKVLEAGENYLEAILMEQKSRTLVRSVDIANALGYSRPTVCVVMQQFRRDGYIEMDQDGYITLTGKGREIAERIYERHIILAETLIGLGVDRETALEDSCKLEHDLSEKSFACIKAHYLKNQKS